MSAGAMRETGTQSLCVALWRGILGLVFPAHCALCAVPLAPGRPTPLCDRCWDALPSIRQPYCPRCGRQIRGATLVPFDTPCGECRIEKPRFGICRSAGLYEGSLRECVHLLKFGDRRELAAAMGLFMAECLARELPGAKYDALVPVPISRARLRERGFNQARDLARALGARAGMPVEARALTRGEGRPSQRTFSRAERCKNVCGDFTVSDAGAVEGRRLLLIDDVYTTGATVDECVRVLLRAGAEAVDVFTLARGA